MRRAAAAALALALCGGAGCGGVAHSARDRAILIVRGAVPDATLWIDEGFVAEIRDARAGVRLPAGRHRVEVRHDRYQAYYGEVALAVGERRAVDVELAPLLD